MEKRLMDPVELYADARIAWDCGEISDVEYNLLRDAALDYREERSPIMLEAFDPRYADDAYYHCE